MVKWVPLGGGGECSWFARAFLSKGLPSLLVALVIGAGCAPREPETFPGGGWCSASPSSKQILKVQTYSEEQQHDFEYSSPFRRLYSQTVLEEVLNKSFYETWTYSEDVLGLPVYKMPTGRSSFSVFEQIPPAGEALQNIWSQFSPSGGSQALTGLYVTCPNETAGLIVKPAVIIQEGTDRWTLVHEILHHAFHIGRQMELTAARERNVSSSEMVEILHNEFLSYQKKTNRFFETRRESDLAEAADSFHTWFEALKSYLLRKDLEEISIELILLKLYSSGELKDVSAGSAQSSFQYIAFSAQAALNTINQQEHRAVELKEMAALNGWTASEQTFARTIDRLHTFENEICYSVREARTSLERVYPEVDILSAFLPDDYRSNCFL